MNTNVSMLRAIAYAFVASLAASFVVILLGMCVFGPHLDHWTEIQGRSAGVVATVSGVVGAVVGLKFALRGSGLIKF